jgi:hypothetical protein
LADRSISRALLSFSGIAHTILESVLAIFGFGAGVF